MTSKDVLNFAREDDFVEYFVFPDRSSIQNENEPNLKALLDNINKLVKEYSADYIWHRDPFTLTDRNVSSLDTNNELEIPSHLYGVTHYGDNIEDEWYIVYLLKQITKDIDGLIVRVVDNDGEFLLIEAAEDLPSWANPENCDKRVYIYRGQLHIIAPDSNEQNDISIQDALIRIRKNSMFTLAPENIQKVIGCKIASYPSKIKENQHRATAYLPIGVAALLNENPQLVAPAVAAFCDRDVIDVKYCRAMKYFPPELRVRSKVTFTRCLYAMLANSKYQPDSKTGWNLPPCNGSKDYKEHSLGMKLACGFEILVAQAKQHADLDTNKSWLKYLRKLGEKNYFKGLLEHSKEYNELLDKAKDYFRRSELSNGSTNSIGNEILETLKTIEFSYESLKEQEKNLSDCDDDDSWMNITPAELDKLLTERYGENVVKFNQGSDPAKFTETLDSFLNHVSDVDGAEFPEKTPDRPPRNKKNAAGVSFAEQNAAGGARVNFDPSSFACAVQDILNFVIPDDENWESSSDSGMSDYGREEGAGDDKMRRLMDEMDRELAATTIGESFKPKEDNFDDVEEFKPVDIDVNALKNILESYKSQMGEAGPSSNMLGPMGIHLDKNESL